MSTDLLPDAPGAPGAPGPAGTRHRRRGWIVLSIGVWNVWVWATRLVNAVRDGGSSAAADVVHGVLFSVSLALGVVLVVVGWRMLREARS